MKLPTGVRALVLALVIFLVAFSLLAFLGRVWWPFDLLGHFRVQYSVMLLPVVIAAFALRQRIVGAVATGVLLINGAIVMPSCDQPGSGRFELSILSANVNSANSDRSRLLQYIDDLRPDVVVILELSFDFAKELESLPDYPTRRLMPRDDNFGIGVLAREPMKLERLDLDAIGGIPSIGITTPLSWTIIATHPMPPAGGAGTERRDAQLEAIAAMVRAAKNQVVVVGDLNTTPWASSFGILTDAGLVDARAGFGLQTTWPAGFSPLAIPIDHCLVTSGIAAVARGVLDDIGSDHYPIYVELVAQAPRD